jgi:hypothetical protein
VYLDGAVLVEAASLDDVLKPGDSALWFGRVDSERTAIWARYKGGDPNARLAEINVRRTVFYPDKLGRDYITVRGFAMAHAATPWAPPTAEQVGLVGTHWSKGWIVENNVISHSRCVGITLGKYGDPWDNTSADTAEGYVLTIERALKNGWSRETIGHHVVRDNVIAHCGQAGIVGSLGAAFSTVTGNTIHDIFVQRQFNGAEQGGINFHAAIDVEIRRNHIYRAWRGIWLDWMAQGTRVTGNLLHDNDAQDLFVEVNHGPFLVDNNVMLSPMSVLSNSQGGAYVHNLMVGSIQPGPDRRKTPFHKPHATDVAGQRDNPCGDDRYYNVFVGRADLSRYDAAARLPVWMGGNVFLNGAKPSKHENDPPVKPKSDPAVKLFEKPDGFLEFAFDKAWAAGRPRKLVTTEVLGRASIPNQGYENPDGTPIRVDADYFGATRDASNPSPGPFEAPGAGAILRRVWPVPRNGG